MTSGWACVLAIGTFLIGGIFTMDAADRQLTKSARAGVIVIDGTAYVLIPAKRVE